MNRAIQEVKEEKAMPLVAADLIAASGLAHRGAAEEVPVLVEEVPVLAPGDRSVTGKAMTRVHVAEELAVKDRASRFDRGQMVIPVVSVAMSLGKAEEMQVSSVVDLQRVVQGNHSAHEVATMRAVVTRVTAVLGKERQAVSNVIQIDLSEKEGNGPARVSENQVRAQAVMNARVTSANAGTKTKNHSLSRA